MKRLISLLLLLNVFDCIAQNSLNIVPMPAKIKTGKGFFVINRNTNIVLQGSGLEKCAAFINDYLQSTVACKLKITTTNVATNCITLNLERPDNVQAGANNLNTDKNGIYIAGKKPEGVFYGIQTLLQLLPVKRATAKNFQLSIPQFSIKDYPRFTYRGMHLDVGRHFIPVSFVKKYIDYLATCKFNTFHWHLTEDQGWRIEIKKYPKLTETGGYRNGTIIGRSPGKGNDSLRYGGFYSQDEIKEVIKYAADRYITIIPEIEMPGHSSAAIAAYPQLSCFPDEDTQHPKETAWAGTTKGKQVQQTWGVFEDVFCPSECTFNFLQVVLDEVMALFPSHYIHIGGDECPKASWKRSAFCQQLIKEKGLKDEHALQSYFIQRIERHINSKGKKIIGWDEILEGGLAPNATVMSWRGEAGGIEAARQHHDAIMTPGSHCYLDHSQSGNEDSVTIRGLLPIEKVYSYEPIPAALNAEQAKHIPGAQGNVCTEYMKTPGKVEYMIFPRMAALAEVLWTPKQMKNWQDFDRRIPALVERLEYQKINFSKAYFAIHASVLPTENYNGILWKVTSKVKKPIFINIGGADSIFVYRKPLRFNKKTSVIASTYKPNLHAAQDLFFNKATGKKTSLTATPSEKYPGDGAFTLVNGVQNDKGFPRSSEFIGFEGKDCEAIIDPGKDQAVSSVIIHTLHQKTNWIWRPLILEVFASADGKTFTSLGLTDDFEKLPNYRVTITVSFTSTSTRYIKVLAKNWSPIPDGEPGAGKNAWLFVDEIEVE